MKKSDSKKTAITVVNYNKYQDIQTTEKQRENSARTAREQQKNTINNDNNVNNDNNKRERSFKPPTLEEVKAYCQERNNNVDPESFMAFYESKGWMVGKNKMKDWQASVRTWERRHKPKTDKIHNFIERDNIDYDELEKRLAKN